MILHAIVASFLISCGTGQNTGFFWHITDMHYDPWYGKPLGISCNENVTEPGQYGDFECDAPWSLVKSSIEAMRNIDNTNPAFILWSGDNAPHVRDSDMEGLVDNDMIIELTRNITNLLKDNFPGKIFLPMVGNHDYYPKNQLPGEENELYNAFYEMWSDWLNTTDMETTFKKGAYYSRVISEDLKVHAVVLNTNLYHHSNEATAGEQDPGGQIAWFENLMNTARQNGEKVLLFYHVPFGKIPEPVDGKGWLVPSRNSYFEQATVEYSDVIMAGISAHSHTDVFKLFYDTSGKAVSSMLIAPSVTPWVVPLAGGVKTPPHNPGLRRVYFDKATYELVDYQQYSMDLSKANAGDVEWKMLYNFAGYYSGVSDARTESLVALLDEFKEYGSNEFNKYYETVYLQTINGDFQPCDCNCKSSHLCAIEFVDYDKFEDCYESRPACGACALQGLGIMTFMAIAMLKLFI